MIIDRLLKLKQKLVTEKDLSKIWLYYMDHFADHAEFTNLGQPIKHEILSSILDAGLTIEAFHEHSAMPWKPIPGLVSTELGFALPTGRERVPMMFSLAARKARPASPGEPAR